MKQYTKPECILIGIDEGQPILAASVEEDYFSSITCNENCKIWHICLDREQKKGRRCDDKEKIRRNSMNKGKAILHAIITALTVCLMTLVVVGIVFLLCFVLRDYPLLTAALMLVVLAVIVGVSSYKYFRKEEEK